MRKTGTFRRMISVALMAAMLLSLLPVVHATTSAGWYGCVVINNDTKDRRVNFRPSPGSSDYVELLDEWLVLELFSTQQKSGYTWYRARNPVTGNLGYIRGDFVLEMTDEEVTEWLSSQSAYFIPSGLVDPGPTAPSESEDPDATAPVLPDTGEVMGFIRLTVSSVNYRSAPNGKILTENQEDKLPLGLVLPYYNVVFNVGGYDWAQVNYDGQVVYIRSDCYGYCDMAGNLVTDGPGSGDIVGTLAPTVTPSPTPGSGVPEIHDGAYGVTTAEDVMFRKTMSTNGDYWAKLPRGWVVEVLDAQMKNNILWYKVSSGTPANPSRTYTGYIHSGYLALYNNGTSTPTPTGGTADSSYAIIMVDGTNLRSTPGGTALGALTSGTIVNVFYVPTGNSANDWYYIGVPWVNSDGYLYGYVPASSLWVIPESELGHYGPLPQAPAASATPSPTPNFSGSGYIILTANSVNIRKTPNGTSLTPKDSDKLKIGTVLAYTEGPTGLIGGYNWVKVTYKGITGYVRSDCYEFCDKDGNPVVVRPTVAPTLEPGATAQPGSQYIKLVKDAVNLRSTPGGTSLAQLRKNTILPYYSITSDGEGTLWYEVFYSNLNLWGYIMSTMAVTCDAQGNEIVTPPVQPTTAPGGNTGYTGYVATSMVKVFIRSAPSASANQIGQVPNKGTLLPVTGVAIWNNPYTWYPVIYNNVRGYIRGDCVFEVAQWQLDAYNQTGTLPTPTAGPATPKPGNSDYVLITGNGQLYVRQTPSTKAEVRGSYQPGDIVRFYDKQTVSGVTWYKVIAPKGGYGWIHGGYARVLSNAEYQQYQPTSVPTSKPTDMPDPATFSDVAFTTDDRVKIRATASMSGKELTMVYTRGTQITYLGRYTAPTASNAYYWFNVRYQSYTGWMRGDYIRILTQSEKEAYEKTGNPDAAPEASYTTLSKGSSGEAVTKLQQKLVEKGFLTPAGVTGYYDTATENAVKAFQKANGLTVDGIAGEKTQHKLFGTVPVGTYDQGSTDTDIYPVEMVDWYTGDIQNVWRVGTVAVITDVRTGISFRAQRLYGSSHADCEPLTVADTAAYCRIYGTSTAQEIADRDKEMQNWRRRPLWVTIGGRTFAASLYGTPHNFDGDVIPDNNFPGQFCVHFVNSRTHDSNVVDYDRAANGYYGHQTAIRDAYNAYWDNH